ncbi:esterase OVCA2-like isoform X4 [Glandiceps talaboti]
MDTGMWILCIHGYRYVDIVYPWIQNAQSFRERTGSLRKILKKVAEFVFITAPNVVPPLEGASNSGDGSQADDQCGWWFSRQDDYFDASDKTDVNKGFDKTLQLLENVFKEQGPFDGVLGFSQGATVVGFLCALKDDPGSCFQFDFAILVAGFHSLSSMHDQYYSKPITCPTLHVYGDTDRVIPKGHFIPASSPQKKVYLEYLQSWLEKKKLRQRQNTGS